MTQVVMGFFEEGINRSRGKGKAAKEREQQGVLEEEAVIH